MEPKLLWPVMTLIRQRQSQRPGLSPSPSAMSHAGFLWAGTTHLPWLSSPGPYCAHKWTSQAWVHWAIIYLPDIGQHSPEATATCYLTLQKVARKPEHPGK